MNRFALKFSILVAIMGGMLSWQTDLVAGLMMIPQILFLVTYIVGWRAIADFVVVQCVAVGFVLMSFIAIYWLLDRIAKVSQTRIASSKVSLPTTRRVAILVASFLVWYQLVIAPAIKMPIQDILGASPPEEIADAAWWEL